MLINEGPSRRSRSGWRLSAYFALMIAVFVIVGAATIIYVRVQATSEARHDANAGTRFAAGIAAKELGADLATLRTSVVSVAANPATRTTLAHPTGCTLSYATSGPGDRGHLDIIRPDGVVVCSSRVRSAGGRPEGYRGAGWFREARLGPVFLAPVADAATGALVAVSAAPTAGGGIVAGFVDLGAGGADLVSRYSGGHPVQFLVVSPAAGRVVIVSSPNPARWIGSPVAGTAFARRGDRVELRGLDGTVRLYEQATVAGLGWRFYVGEDKAAVLAAAGRLQTRQLEIILPGLVLMLLVVLLVYRRVANPVKALGAAVRASGLHTPRPLVAAVGPTEVAALGDDINGLIASVNRELHERTETEHQRGRLAAIVESSGDAILTRDRGGVITSWNRGAERLYGYSAAETIGRPAAMLIPKDHAGEDEVILDRVLAGDEGAHYETVRVGQDGTRLGVSLTASALCDSAGNVVGVSTVARDITEQAAARDRLAASERRYREIVETANEGIWMTDADGESSFVNPRMAEMLGYTPDEMIGRPLDYFMDDRGRVAAAASDQHVEDANAAFDEWRFIRKDGAALWSLISRSPVTSPSGEHQGTLAMVTDITDRRAADSARRASDRQLQAIMDQTTSVISVKDRERRYTLVNREFERVVGVNRDELLGRTADWLVPPGIVSALHDEARRVLEEGEVVTAERTARGLGEERTYLIVSFPLPDESGCPAGMCVMASDITVVKQTQRALEDLNGELEKRVVSRTKELAAANQGLEAFSYSVSHDLRAPLRAVSGFGHILETEYGERLPAEGQRYLRLVQDGAHNMGVLIDDLLNFSRLGRQPAAKQILDPTALAERALAELLAQGTFDPALVVTIAKMSSCEADPALLHQVFQNLLSNALKFTSKKEGPVIEVGATDMPHDGGRRPSGLCVYYVRDNGVGFDPRYADKLFGVFQRLHRAEDYEGTGIGLALVERIVRRHGGRIWAESAPDEGATFFFTLESEAPQWIA